MRVCLDPGHGGKDRANRGPTGYVEADGVLDIALKVRVLLKPYPIEVVLIRDRDITLEPKKRVAVVNKTNADIVVSIHTDAGPPEAHGTTTFHSIFSPPGKLGNKLATLIQENVVKEAGTYNRGVRTRKGRSGRDYYYIIRETKMTAVIVECAFHTNPREEQLLKTDEFRWKCARGIAKGIVAYFGLERQEAEEVKEESKQLTPIIAEPRATVEQAQEWARKRGATETFVNLVPLYWKYAPERGGVDPAGAYCQAAKETGFGRFGGVIDESYHNPCGMKVKQGGGNYDPNAHQRFSSWEEGIKAHLDHLALYAGAKGYPRKDTLDPRHFAWIKGKAATFEELGSRWAPNPDYGKSIVEDYLKPLMETKVQDSLGDKEKEELRAKIKRLEERNQKLSEENSSLKMLLLQVKNIVSEVK